MRSPAPSLPVLFGIALLVVVALANSGEIRDRAADGLGRGMPEREAALARGFVLGEDDEVDARTEEDFRRAGLSHLLAVSGQNVTLLALLAMPLLGALGIPLRERLFWVLALIAVYVPVAGAGPSIQRAGVMGALGLLATLGGRRGSRLYALAIAAAVTLAIDPGIAADVGWQLSFAAVLGILLLAGQLRERIVASLGDGSWRRALAEGLAVTVAATLATAPLIAYHFETLSTTTLAANVLALPAVAPAMWLGMCSAGLAQLPGVPLEPLNGLDALLLAYVAQVAEWCAAPSWAELQVHLGGLGLLFAYLGLGVGLLVCWRWPGRSLAIAAVAVACWLPLPSLRGAAAEPPRGLRVVVLDVGQGDAILLQPAHAPAVLVDGGPPGDGLARKLDRAGVDGLGAVVVTHDQSDHVGGVEDLVGALPVERLLFARLHRGLVAAAAGAGADPQRIAAGQVLRSGALRLRVLWPPAELLATPVAGQDPNQLALVLEARWRDFSMLLTADAEAEAVPLEPGPVDVLKVAHHGSDDAGLGALLERTRPRLAVISVGEGNSYGHPTAGTLATLARHRVPTLRTDEDGPVVIDVTAGAMTVDG
ncbi:MAG TPA: ComEC/Rec2 family competence protein [Solirubrobacterales bacterium]|jgi:competence protein ComEC|nr:ComEC/Rec2 family competence protein [Solirubrobacterales bacterium]